LFVWVLRCAQDDGGGKRLALVPLDASLISFAPLRLTAFVGRK